MRPEVTKRWMEIEALMDAPILEFAAKNRDWSTSRLAEKFCCGYEYMRKLLKANGLRRHQGSLKKGKV